MRQGALPAAVFLPSDPRSATAVRLVPSRADLVTIGNATLGYNLDRYQPERAFSLGLLRLREIEGVIRCRHGVIVPDPEDTDDRPLCLDYGRAVTSSHPAQDLFQWSRRWMPWADPDEVYTIVDEEGWRRSMAGADEVAAMMLVRLAERQALGLRTIGACDITRTERAAASKSAKLDRDRERQAERRRAEGRVDRGTYLKNSLEAQRPWESLEMSRAKYFREKRLGRLETGVSPTILITTSGDGPVSQDRTGEAEAA